MMKIVASLVILGLCANVAFGVGVAPVSSSQSGAFVSTVLNSSAVQIIKLSNATDAAVYDSSSTTTDVAGVDDLIFGPGASNDTSYVWGLLSSQPTSAVTTGGGSCGAAGASGCGYVYTLSSLRKRTINNTIAGYGNDTTQASVIGDTAVTVSIIGNSRTYGVGPGYLAVLSKGLDTVGTPNQQVYVTIVNGATGASSQKTLTTTADVWASTAAIPAVGTACATTTFSLGNIWYDQYSGAFFYTYSKNLVTTAVATAAGTCPTSGSTTTNTIYLGAIYVNGTALLTTPISVSAATAANSVSSLIGGVDNSNYASYVWLAYKDNAATTPTTYVSKTLISVNTTAVGTFSSLVADSIPATPTGTGASTYVTMQYTPAAIWASNFTYAVTVQNTTTSTAYTGTTAGASTYTYGYTNYFNGTTTGVDTGITIGGAAGSLAGYQAWQLNTGYSVVSATQAATGSPAVTTYSLATYYANGTANATSVTAATFSYGGPQFYEDVNGTMWVGWSDVDTSANGQLVTNAYLAKFQGQVNIPTFANVISTVSAFFALFLAAIFVF